MATISKLLLLRVHLLHTETALQVGLTAHGLVVEEHLVELFVLMLRHFLLVQRALAVTSDRLLQHGLELLLLGHGELIGGVPEHLATARFVH